MRPPTLLAAIL